MAYNMQKNNITADWDYTEDFSEAKAGDPLHKMTGSTLIIDKIIIENNVYYPMVAGVIFRDIRHYKIPIYAFRKKKINL